MLRTLLARLQKPALLLFVTWLLYVVGLKFLLVPVLLVVTVIYLPMPKIFESWLSRLFGALLILMSLLQVAATLQFLLVPKSGFVVLSLLTVVLECLVLLLAPAVGPRPRAIVNSTDVFALLVSVFFLAPFTPIFIGRHSVEHISQIGSIQAIDATNHYAAIAEMTQAQHLNYKVNYYYPKGFHLSVGFIENTVIKRQASLSWLQNAYLFFTDYVVLSMMLAYGLFYLCLRWLQLLRGESKDVGKRVKALLTLTLGPILALLYLLPFVNEGFLNYYYVCIAVVVALLYVADLKVGKKELDLAHDPAARWNIFAFLLLIYGVTMSWPLLMPPFVLVGILFALPDGLQWKHMVKQLWHWNNVPIALVLLVQLVPIYFQLKFSGTDTTQGINLLGGLRQFHPYILLLGFGLTVVVMCSKRITETARAILLQTLIPLFAFIALLACMQYFTTGEIRYYVIKSSMLLELLTLALSVAMLLFVWLQSNSPIRLKYALFLPVIPFVVFLLLISSVDNPLKDARDLFRNYSGEAKPQYLDQDDATYIKLAEAGKIKHFNSTTLHYNADQGKLFAHMQLPFWNNMMQYDASTADFNALTCEGNLYANLAFGTYSDADQIAMIAKLKQCAGMAKARGETFYVITDHDSAAKIRQTFGNMVTVVY